MALLCVMFASGVTVSAATVSIGDDLTSKTLVANQAPYIPPQCYTKTVDANHKVHNPCMTCHTQGQVPNFINDTDVQFAYSFADYAKTNHWLNVFKQRDPPTAALSDAAMLAYVQQDNYQSQPGTLDLANQLQHVPAGWDFDKDGQWSGYVPDSYFQFDAQGFDHAPDGQFTGWRAFAYTPFPGTFWPTNGSTDDVLIRLAALFQHNAAGEFDLNTYRVNLAIVEALITRRNVTIPAVDEAQWGVDLDKDGKMATASQITFAWQPLKGQDMAYVGQARQQQMAGKLHLAAGLFPEGTEFLHSVRYLNVDEQGNVGMANRMKELRYAIKTHWRTYTQLQQQVLAEFKEKDTFPERLRNVFGNVETGVSNGQGWVYQGFIEDRQGALRPQTFEESVACIGCHSGIGATTDGIFAFPRKLAAPALQEGWSHWRQRGLEHVPEPRLANGDYEYTHYLQSNGAGDEFRENREVQQRFFTPEGVLKDTALQRLHNDMSYLLLPTAARALALNKAYQQIVAEQSFIYGRDALLAPPQNVHQQVKDGQATGIQPR